jgi:hypothetical protein
LVLSNVSLADAGAYQVVVTNVTGSVTSEAAMLVVADLDRDQDGLPDDWERAHHLDPESAADAAQDSDGDGLTNWQEYVAGTDPQDPASVLKVLSLILPSGGPSSAEPLTLVFPAIAGKTYSVLYIPSPLSTSWHVLTSIVNLATDQCVTVQDSNLNLQTKRFYRITTPAVP